MDPSGVVLEKVCSPVTEYLYNREDTVRCIVASLTNDCDSELAEVCCLHEHARTCTYILSSNYM